MINNKVTKSETIKINNRISIIIIFFLEAMIRILDRKFIMLPRKKYYSKIRQE
jgi:hypothetical protein